MQFRFSVNSLNNKESCIACGSMFNSFTVIERANTISTNVTQSNSFVLTSVYPVLHPLAPEPYFVSLNTSTSELK